MFNKKTKSGNMALSGMVFFFLLIILLILFEGTAKKSMLTDTRDSVATAMVASNLAASCPDPEILGSQGISVLGDNNSAYTVYVENLKKNLGLNPDMTPQDNSSCSSTIDGPVNVSQLIIYNVTAGDVTINTYTAVGSTSQTIPNGVGVVTTPNGIKVSKSGVYSELSFNIKILAGYKSQKTMRQFTDVRVTN